MPDSIAHRDADHPLRVISPLDGTDVGSVRPVHRRLMAAAAAATAGRSPSLVFG